MSTPVTHYNASVSVLSLKTAGTGDCGKSGTVTGYPGMVTCSECKHFAQADMKTMASLHKGKSQA